MDNRCTSFLSSARGIVLSPVEHAAVRAGFAGSLALTIEEKAAGRARLRLFLRAHPLPPDSERECAHAASVKDRL